MDPQQTPPPGPEPVTPSTGATTVGEPTKDDRTMALLAHLLGIVTSFIGPLIIWIIKKDDSPFVDDQGKEALNFQLTVLIVYVVLIVGSCVTFGLAGLLYFPLLVAVIVLGIIAAMKANEGQRYRYPLTLRLIK